MPSNNINVAIVDDHTLFRKILKDYLSESDNIKVVIQSPDIPDLLAKLKDNTIHVLILDIFMPVMNGHEAVPIITAAYPEIKILVLTMCTDIGLLSDLLEAGVYGIISKAEEPEQLLRAIVSLSEQRIYRSKLFTEVMYWNKQHTIQHHANLPSGFLDKREKEILHLLWEEKSNKEIADHLYLSIRSIEKIRQHMKEKLGVTSTVGLLKYAINNKIIGVNSLYTDTTYNTENR